MRLRGISPSQPSALARDRDRRKLVDGRTPAWLQRLSARVPREERPALCFALIVGLVCLRQIGCDMQIVCVEHLGSLSSLAEELDLTHGRRTLKGPSILNWHI